MTLNDTRPTADDIEVLRTERDNAQIRLSSALNYGGLDQDAMQQVENAEIELADCQIAFDETIKNRHQW